MVYGICYCPLSQEKLLKDEKCSDSKTLTEIQREEIFGNLCKLKDSIGWIVEAISPNVISNEMYRRQKCSLNQIAQNSTVSLIQKCIDSGVNVTEIYVDTVGMPDKYQVNLLIHYNKMNFSGLGEGTPEINKRLLPTNNIYCNSFLLIMLFYNRPFGGSSLLQDSKGSMKEAYSNSTLPFCLLSQCFLVYIEFC